MAFGAAREHVIRRSRRQRGHVISRVVPIRGVNRKSSVPLRPKIDAAVRSARLPTVLDCLCHDNRYDDNETRNWRSLALFGPNARRSLSVTERPIWTRSSFSYAFPASTRHGFTKYTHRRRCRPPRGVCPVSSPPGRSRCVVSSCRRLRTHCGHRRRDRDAKLLRRSRARRRRPGKPTDRTAATGTSGLGTRSTGTRSDPMAPFAPTGRPRPPSAWAWRLAAAGHPLTWSRCPWTSGFGAGRPRPPSSPSARNRRCPATGTRPTIVRRPTNSVRPSALARHAGRGWAATLRTRHNNAGNKQKQTANVIRVVRRRIQSIYSRFTPNACFSGTFRVPENVRRRPP